MAETHLVDGSMSFAGGVNSLKPTTISSPQHPDGLMRNQLAWLNNATVRGGGVTPRGGWKYLTTLPISGLYQGGFMYEKPGDLPYLIVSIAGRLYRVRVDRANEIDELSTDPVNLNPQGIDQFYFVQGEEFMVVQTGDLVTLPLIWDGTTLRRSEGTDLILKGYIDQDSWAIPAIDGSSTVVVTMSQPYVGAVSDQVFLKFEGTFEVMAIGAMTITLRTISSPYAGQTIHRGVFDAFQVYLMQHQEIPPAGPMVYYMGRFFYAVGRTVSGGDIVKGSSGSLAYDFRDSILNVTENPLAIGGDGFTVPSEAGNITALKYTGEMDTTLGQGQLYMFTRRSIYRLAVPVSRDAWINANDATQPLQTVIQLRYGTVGDRCVVQVNEDLFYQTMETAIRSLRLAQKQSRQWGNTAISRNEDRVLRFNDKDLMKLSSGILSENRLLMTALPVQTPIGVAHQAVMSLDYDLISTLEEQLPPAWEGIYEGLPIFQLFEADFNGDQRAFAVVRGSGSDNPIQIWEFTDDLKTDENLDGEKRINWVVETPAYTWGQEFLWKKLVGGELWVDRVYGEVLFKVEYRPDGDACWHFWHEWKICSARNSCEDVSNPICYPVIPYGEGFRQNMSLPLPQQDCQETSQRQMNWGYQFQVRITVTGFCRIRGLLLYAEPVEKKMYTNLICPGQPEASAQSAITTTGPTYIFSSPADPFLGPPYPPVGYELFISRPTGGPTLLTWTVPDVIIDALITSTGLGFVEIRVVIENYEYPLWNAGTPYIPNQRVTWAGTRWVSLSNNTNKQPDLFNGTDWTNDPTVFELWFFDFYAGSPTQNTWIKIGDSETPGGPAVWLGYDQMAFLAGLVQNFSLYVFQLRANAGISAIAYSNEFGVPVPAP